MKTPAPAANIARRWKGLKAAWLSASAIALCTRGIASLEIGMFTCFEVPGAHEKSKRPTLPFFRVTIQLPTDSRDSRVV